MAPPPPDEPAPQWPELSPAECEERIRAGGVVVLDVRTPPEHETRRIDGSKLMPVQILQMSMAQLQKDAVYIVHCEHGMRSTDACYLLKRAGFPNVYEMAGGLANYTGATVRGPVAR